MHQDTSGGLPITSEESTEEKTPQINTEQPKDVNLQPVGLANTRMSTTDPMIGENRQLVTNEPVEFEK